MDADGQHDPISIHGMCQVAIVDKCDLVVDQRQYCARFSERLYALYFKVRYKINAPLSSLKLYKTKFYKNIGFFENYDSTGTELLLVALKRKKRVLQKS